MVFSWRSLPCPYDTGLPECVRHRCHRKGGCDTWCPFRYDIDGNRPREKPVEKIIEEPVEIAVVVAVKVGKLMVELSDYDICRMHEAGQ
jgi:hypothetical protein